MSDAATRYYIDFEYFDSAGVYHGEHGIEVSQGDYMKFYRGRGEMCVTPRGKGYTIGECP